MAEPGLSQTVLCGGTLASVIDTPTRLISAAHLAKIGGGRVRKLTVSSGNAWIGDSTVSRSPSVKGLSLSTGYTSYTFNDIIPSDVYFLVANLVDRVNYVVEM